MTPMCPVRHNAPIDSWRAGDSVSGFALLSRKERRQDRNNREYLDLDLTDATGSITAKVWADSPAMDGDFDSHDFVAFSGRVKEYRDSLQVSVNDCRRVTEADRRDGFDEALLVPSTPEDIDDLWRRLGAIYPGRIARPALARLAAQALEAHGAALREHPAAKTIHHAYRGGLLEHVVSMAELALAVAAHYRQLDADQLLVGVLFHDLGKLDELGSMPANDYTDRGRLVGHVVMGRDLLREVAAGVPELDADTLLRLEHLVLSHQGRLEYGSPVEPATAEAVALNAIDNLDAKLAQFRQAGAAGSGFTFLRGMRRHVLIDEASAGGAAADEPDEAEPAPTQTRLEI